MNGKITWDSTFRNTKRMSFYPFLLLIVNCYLSLGYKHELNADIWSVSLEPETSASRIDCIRCAFNGDYADYGLEINSQIKQRKSNDYLGGIGVPETRALQRNLHPEGQHHHSNGQPCAEHDLSNFSQNPKSHTVSQHATSNGLLNDSKENIYVFLNKGHSKFMPMNPEEKTRISESTINIDGNDINLPDGQIFPIASLVNNNRHGYNQLKDNEIHKENCNKFRENEKHKARYRNSHNQLKDTDMNNAGYTQPQKNLPNKKIMQNPSLPAANKYGPNQFQLHNAGYNHPQHQQSEVHNPSYVERDRQDYNLFSGNDMHKIGYDQHQQNLPDGQIMQNVGLVDSNRYDHNQLKDNRMYKTDYNQHRQNEIPKIGNGEFNKYASRQKQEKELHKISHNDNSYFRENEFPIRGLTIIQNTHNHIQPNGNPMSSSLGYNQMGQHHKQQHINNDIPNEFQHPFINGGSQTNINYRGTNQQNYNNPQPNYRKPSSTPTDRYQRKGCKKKIETNKKGSPKSNHHDVKPKKKQCKNAKTIYRTMKINNEFVRVPMIVHGPGYRLEYGDDDEVLGSVLNGNNLNNIAPATDKTNSTASTPTSNEIIAANPLRIANKDDDSNRKRTFQSMTSPDASKRNAVNAENERNMQPNIKEHEAPLTDSPIHFIKPIDANKRIRNKNFRGKTLISRPISQTEPESFTSNTEPTLKENKANFLEPGTTEVMANNFVATNNPLNDAANSIATTDSGITQKIDDIEQRTTAIQNDVTESSTLQQMEDSKSKEQLTQSENRLYEYKLPLKEKRRKTRKSKKRRVSKKYKYQEPISYETDFIESSLETKKGKDSIQASSKSKRFILDFFNPPKRKAKPTKPSNPSKPTTKLKPAPNLASKDKVEEPCEDTIDYIDVEPDDCDEPDESNYNRNESNKSADNVEPC